jgi:hypothetical protein
LSLKLLKASDVDLAQAARAIALAFEALGDGEAPGKRQAAQSAQSPPAAEA